MLLTASLTTSTAFDLLRDEVDARLGEIEALLDELDTRPVIFDPCDITRAGVFVSIGADGVLDGSAAAVLGAPDAHILVLTAGDDLVIVDAMTKGRIAAASREHFRAMLDKDEDTATALIASLPENTVPVVELGTQSGPSAEDAEFRKYFPGVKEA